MKKWLFAFLVIAVLIVCVVSISARVFLSKEYLALEIEDSINSRVQIGALEVSLFSVPARITLKDVILAKRDAVADARVAYNERKALTDGEIKLNEVSFKVSLGELISKKIQVDAFELDGLHANITLHEDGSNSLDPLFAAPEEGSKEERKQEKSFNAKDKEEFVTELKSIKITNVSCDLVVEKTGLLVKGQNGNLELSDIRVDPNQLEVVNQANLALALQLNIYDGVGMQVEYGELGIDGVALTQLFDPQTGEIDPDVEFDFQISESAYVSSKVPYVQKVWSKGEKLEKLGLKIGNLPERAEFGRGRKLSGSYKRGRVDLTSDVSIVVRDWEIAANQGSWLDSGSEQHAFFVDVCASKKASESVTQRSERLLKKLPKELRSDIEQKLHGSWLKDGKLTLQIHTSKSLSSPKIKILTEFPDVNELIKEATQKGALDFLLKKLK